MIMVLRLRPLPSILTETTLVFHQVVPAPDINVSTRAPTEHQSDTSDVVDATVVGVSAVVVAADAVDVSTVVVKVLSTAGRVGRCCWSV